jgi:broad specificity phosphatase PhoE
MYTKITYFVHGTTIDNERAISSGWYDVDLSERGIQQAKELGELTKDKHFDVVYCSDLKRAFDSASLAWGNKYKIIIDKRLRECNYGDYNGHSADLVESLQERALTEPFPNGESYSMVKERLASFLEDVNRDYRDRHVAIIAHKAPQLAMDVLLKNLTWEQAFAEDWRKKKLWQPGWDYQMR